MQSFISVGLRLDKIQRAGLTRALAGHHSLAVSVLPDGSSKLATGTLSTLLCLMQGASLQLISATHYLKGERKFDRKDYPCA
jgi:hypothetical protein